MELLSDEKKLEEEREVASQTKNRYKGTGNTSGGFGSGGYGGESYEGVGSDVNKPKKRREEDYGNSYGGGNNYGASKEREAPREYTGSGGGKYDPSVGESNLMKKLGIQPEKKKEADKPNDEVIQFPEDNKTQTQQKSGSLNQPNIATTISPITPKTAAQKFLPPPPSKSGAPVQSGSVITNTGNQKANSSAGSAADDLLGFDLGAGTSISTQSTQKTTTQAPPTILKGNKAGGDLLGMDLLGGSSAPVQQHQQIKPTGFGGIGGNASLGGMIQPQQQSTGGFGSMGQMGGNFGGMGQTNQMAGMGTGIGQMGGFNSSMGGMMGSSNGVNAGFGSMNGFQTNGNNMNTGIGNIGGGMAGMSSGMGGGFGAGNNGFGSYTGFGGSTGFGTGSQQDQSGQKKLITFDSKAGTAQDDFGGFQEAKNKTAVTFYYIRDSRTSPTQRLTS